MFLSNQTLLPPSAELNYFIFVIVSQHHHLGLAVMADSSA